MGFRGGLTCARTHLGDADATPDATRARAPGSHTTVSRHQGFVPNNREVRE